MPKPSKVPLRVAAEAPVPSSSSPAAASGAPAKPDRRHFSAAEKLRIVRAADACSERGQIEKLLRREGIYSSLLTAWRKALRLHGETGLATRTPGRPPTHDARDQVIAQLQRDKARLTHEVELVGAVVALQKKLRRCCRSRSPRARRDAGPAACRPRDPADHPCV